jgi:hypothetical protein
MSDYYTRVGAYRDRCPAEAFGHGIGQQEITVVMTDDSDAPSWRTLSPAVCRLPSDRAREFALVLLALTQATERSGAR